MDEQKLKEVMALAVDENMYCPASVDIESIERRVVRIERKIDNIDQKLNTIYERLLDAIRGRTDD